MEYIDMIPAISELIQEKTINSSLWKIEPYIINLNNIKEPGVNYNIINIIITPLCCIGVNVFNTIISIYDSFILDIPFTEIINFSPSHDFNYHSFMKSSKRMIEAITTQNNVSLDIFSNKSPLVNRNIQHSNYSYSHLLYLFFIFIKSNLACYIAFIYFLITYFFVNISSINVSLNKFSFYLFLLLLQVKPVLGANIVLTNKLISSLGWLVYIFLMSIYDIFYKNIQSRHVSQTLVIDGKINFRFLRERLFLGFIFLLVINTGVLFSNSFFNVTITFLNIPLKIVAIISSFIISTVTSVCWLYLTRKEKLGYNLYVMGLSCLRSISESIAFNALSYANYILWSFLPATRTIYTLTFIIGLILYFIVSFFQVILETKLQHRFWYGFIYNFVFTFLSISSSGLYYLMNITNATFWLKVLLIILCNFFIILLPLEIYRYRRTTILEERSNNSTLIEYLIGRLAANNDIIIILISILYQLIVFFSFAIGTFIWLDLAGLTT